MTMNDSGNRTVLAIIAILVAVAIPGLREATWFRIGFAVVGGLVVLAVVVEQLHAWHDRRELAKADERIGELIRLTRSKDSDDQARGGAIYTRLAPLYGLKEKLEAADGFRELAETPGPNQLLALRLVLVNMWPSPGPWATAIADADGLLSTADLTDRETEDLEKWRAKREA
jgi:hypothetical protein